MGSETIPVALSMSRYQARPRPETFRSLICLRGLKCWPSKLRPLMSQLAPSVSDATRAAFTLPIWAGLSAKVEDNTIIATAKLTQIKESIFQLPEDDGFDTVTFPEIGLPRFWLRLCTDANQYNTS